MPADDIFLFPQDEPLCAPPSAPLSIPRLRGGQPGNTNALKHGLYARLFRASELARLVDVKPASLHEEIDMFRLIIRRLIDHARDLNGLQDEMRYIIVLSHALGELTRMVKVQQVLPRSSPAIDALEQALQEIQLEWETTSGAASEP